MGKRQEGKVKKKSIKAKITSLTSSKRLLSRHGKQVKKGLAGPSTDFVTRSAALKRLQVTLKDFRRLCILKGIYPRVPPKAPKGSDKVYYDIKDLSYLSHEPLLHKFREFKGFMKKIRKAAGRKEFSEARRRDDLKPVMTLDHLVKERYPRFIDALRDLDDPLCMIFLFASMPSTGRITAPKTLACAELCRHWLYYVAKARCLHKVFASVKGFYYQAEIMGEKVTWLVPHQFTQTIPREVDLRVMMTFLDFYEVFVRFVLFKLYASQGLRYPPAEDKKALDAGGCLLAVRAAPVEGGAGSGAGAGEGGESLAGAVASAAAVAATAQAASAAAAADKDKGKGKGKAAQAEPAAAARIASLQDKLRDLEELDEDDEDDEGEGGAALAAPLAAAFSGLQDPDDDEGDDEGEEISRRTFAKASEGEGERDRRARLFSKLRFFISREVPLEWLQVCTLSFGAQVGWDGPASPFSVSDPGITHHVIDRPAQQSGGAASGSRELVQPQWVFDCINAQYLLPTAKYRPGAALPPHLSPFVDDDKEGHVPSYRKEILSIVSAEAGAGAGAGGKGKAAGKGKGAAAAKEELDESGDDEDDEDEDAAARRYAREVRAEKSGSGAAAGKGSKRAREEEEEDEDDDDDDDDDEEEEEEEPPAVLSKKGPKGVVFQPKEKAMTEVRLFLSSFASLFSLSPTLSLSLSSASCCFFLFSSSLSFFFSFCFCFSSRERESQHPVYRAPPPPKRGGGFVAVVVYSPRQIGLAGLGRLAGW